MVAFLKRCHTVSASLNPTYPGGAEQRCASFLPFKVEPSKRVNVSHVGVVARWGPAGHSYNQQVSAQCEEFPNDLSHMEEEQSCLGASEFCGVCRCSSSTGKSLVSHLVEWLPTFVRGSFESQYPKKH